MRVDHQQTIFDIIKRKVSGQDSLGNIIGDVLSISQDAVYRRTRGETQLTIFELEKLCKHFDISLDSIFEMNKNRVLFDFKPLDSYDLGLESYLQGIHDGFSGLKMLKNPEVIITTNNVPFLQMMNFPHLIRYKLFFWAKAHLHMPKYQNVKFGHEKLTPNAFKLGRDILQMYNSIPSTELYDPELLRGLTREIYYNFQAQHFEEPKFALTLLRQMDQFLDHLQEQAKQGKKFTFGTTPPANGNDFKMFYNESFNSIFSIHYQSDSFSGLYIAHNILNSLHTTDPVYVKESRDVVNKQLIHSSLISSGNEKERVKYFSEVRKMINKTRIQIELDLEE